MNFFCEECEDEFFSQNHKCVKRENFDDNKILKYQKKMDKALICKKGYFLKNGICQENPSGDKNCEIYKNKKECKFCKNTHYYEKSNNKCQIVKNKNLIKNCIYYKNEKKCEKCKEGYYLNFEMCKKTHIKNCKIFKSLTKCQKCKENFYFNSITENCEENKIENCLQINEKSPKICKTCEKKFFPNEQFCSPILKEIENCLIYENSEKCRICKKGFFLTKNAETCETSLFSQIDENCEIYKELENPICSFCKPGFYFENGICNKCREVSFFSGCFSCNPYDKGKCFICRSGFFMDFEGICRKGEEIEFEDFGGILDGCGFRSVFLFFFVILRFF